MRFLSCGLFAICIFVTCFGCGKQPTEIKSGNISYSNLKSIGSAYMQATDALNRPPRAIEELLPYLQQHGDPNAILRSPLDGEAYGIVWDVDYRNPPTSGPQPPLTAYERFGKDGKRYICQFRHVSVMPNDKFLQTFPFAANPASP